MAHNMRSALSTVGVAVVVTNSGLCAAVPSAVRPQQAVWMTTAVKYTLEYDQTCSMGLAGFRLHAEYDRTRGRDDLAVALTSVRNQGVD